MLDEDSLFKISQYWEPLRGGLANKQLQAISLDDLNLDLDLSSASSDTMDGEDDSSNIANDDLLDSANIPLRERPGSYIGKPSTFPLPLPIPSLLHFSLTFPPSPFPSSRQENPGSE